MAEYSKLIENFFKKGNLTMKRIKIILALICSLILISGGLNASFDNCKFRKGINLYGESFTAFAVENENLNSEVFCPTRGKKSVDNAYILLASAVKADVSAYKAAGYEVTKDGETATYSSDRYYRGISVRTSIEDETVRTVYTAADIYSDETLGECAMIVEEIKYSAESQYNIKPFLVTDDDRTVYGTEIVVKRADGAPAQDYYLVTKKTNKECIEDAGVWHYHADGTLGTHYGFEKEPYHENSTVETILNVVPDASKNLYFYFRYQPNQVEVGKYYTMKLEVMVSSSCELRLASRKADSSPAAYTVVVKENVTKTISFVGYRNTAEPFSIRINSKVNDETVKISVKLISVEANDGTDLPDYQGGTRISDDYSIEKQTNSYVSSHPGKWFYYCDGTLGVDYQLSAIPSYDNGVITFAFNKMAEGSPSYQLRFQPTFGEGAQYTVTFKVTLSAAGKVVYGTDYKAVDFAAAGTKTVTWKGGVQAASTNKPFLIQFRSTDRNAPITMTISDIVFTQI